MDSQTLRKAYLEFFKERGHAIVPSSSLLPENDPTTLFTGSGMQPMIQYLLGAKHPQGTRVADSQLCFRTGDIDEVGDNRHTTFFEMLGNWSFGDYFKSDQLSWIFQFMTGVVGLDPARLYVTVFRGNEELGLPRDTESAQLWQELFTHRGIEAPVAEFAERNGLQGGRIFYYPEEKNWWSRAGVPQNMPVGEPGGPDSEIFWDFGADHKFHEQSTWKKQPCHVNCDCGRFLEIGNSVFMQYVKTSSGFEPLKHPNVDYGGGLERLLMASSGAADIFSIDMFAPLLHQLERLSGRSYAGGSELDRSSMRIIVDHLRAATFLIADGVSPSNKDQGYFVRRLIRRAVRFAKNLNIGTTQIPVAAELAKSVIAKYQDTYPHLKDRQAQIISELSGEEQKFGKTLANGLAEFEKMSGSRITGKDAFILLSTYGFPLEMTKELAAEKNIEINQQEFDQEFKKHQDLSRTASAGKFKGGLADHSVATTRLHTAHHLLLAALRQVLGDHVEQRGSNITSERLRIDFSHPTALTPDQLKTVEDLVNQKIKENLAVEWEEIPLEQARKIGAIGVFGHKYGEKVKVYKMYNHTSGKIFSLEICGGPHVKKTAELGKFSITGEEASSAGVRRIKAVLAQS